MPAIARWRGFFSRSALPMLRRSRFMRVPDFPESGCAAAITLPGAAARMRSSWNSCLMRKERCDQHVRSPQLKTRRELMLEEMGLVPTWRLRMPAPAGAAAEVVGVAAGDMHPQAEIAASQPA